MDKEEIKEEVAVTTDIAQGTPSAREELKTLLNEIVPENERSEDVDSMALNYIKKQSEFNERMVEALSKDERFAQVMVDVVNGKSNAAAALARYYGKGFLSAEEGSPEYEEMMAAENSRNEELANIKAATEEYNANFDESMKTIAPFAEENGLDADEFRIKIEDEILIPLLSGKWDKELLTKLNKALMYDKDTEDAFAAGQVKGRNENINKLRAMPSDGMPKGLNSQASVDKKRVKNSLIEQALNA